MTSQGNKLRVTGAEQVAEVTPVADVATIMAENKHRTIAEQYVILAALVDIATADANVRVPFGVTAGTEGVWVCEFRDGSSLTWDGNDYNLKAAPTSPIVEPATFDSLRRDNGEYASDGIEYALVAHAVHDYDFEERESYYHAEGFDREGNAYEFRWEVSDGFDSNDDDEGSACDWQVFTASARLENDLAPWHRRKLQ